VISPFYEIGQVLTFLYYFLILMIFPFCGFIEKVIYVWYITKHSTKFKRALNASLDPFYNINVMLAIELGGLYYWLIKNKAGFKFFRAHTSLAEKYAGVILKEGEELFRSSCVNFRNYLRASARLYVFDWNCLNVDRVFSFFDEAERSRDAFHFSIQCARLLAFLFLREYPFLNLYAKIK
jgi:hypothetical protein